MAVDTDVLIIGAGPIGLINAWGMKRLNPHLKITVLEKYKQYQRTHTLVVDPKQLKAVIAATESQDDPKLQVLLSQIEKDPHIRTNVLQEVFTGLATDSGVEILTEQEVNVEDLEQRLENYPNVSLIIGADGTHSVVSKGLFSEDNQVKYEYDYVLQLRFDILGQEKAPGIRTQQFFQFMARKGLIGNEYMGHFDEHKTPVTMQVMISKEDFLNLQKASSKNPIKPFAHSAAAAIKDMPRLPPHLKSFLSAYLVAKIQDCNRVGQTLDEESIRLSVNEAPATHAKKIVTNHGNSRVVLEGDSALGLSYFKGLNAGLQASAQFLSTMKTSIQDSFHNIDTLDSSLKFYQEWFLKDFAPKKVEEVGLYSFLWIRSAMYFMETVQWLKNGSMADFDDDLMPIIQTYFRHLVKNLGKEVRWKLYPHRSYELVQFWQLDYVPLVHTAKKIVKIAVDYMKPYKGRAQIIQDFKQPLVGFANASIGVIKVFKGIFSLNIKLFMDGLLSCFRGVLEMGTTLLTWFVKPIIRGLLTIFHGGYKKIEDNEGLQNLVQLGQTHLKENNGKTISSHSKVCELLGICHDLHRKYLKACSRGQSSALDQKIELKTYEDIMQKTEVDRQVIAHYLSLFSASKARGEVKENESPRLIECDV